MVSDAPDPVTFPLPACRRANAFSCRRAAVPSEFGKVCDAYTFQCANGACVSLEWKCDGMDDCGDYSDEANCGKEARPPARHAADPRRQFLTLSRLFQPPPPTFPAAPGTSSTSVKTDAAYRRGGSATGRTTAETGPTRPSAQVRAVSRSARARRRVCLDRISFSCPCRWRHPSHRSPRPFHVCPKPLPLWLRSVHHRLLGV